MSEKTPTWSDPVPGYRWLRVRLESGIYYILRPIKKVNPKTGKKYSTWQPISLGTRDEKEAIAEYETRIGKPVARNRAIRCTEAFDKYIVERKLKPSSRRLYKGLWKTWIQGELGDLRVADVDPEDIIRVLNKMKTTKSKKTGELVSDARRYNCYVAMSAFFTACATMPYRHRPDNPVNYIGKDNIPPEPEQGQIDADELVVPTGMIEELAGYLGARQISRREDERVNAIVLMTYVLLHPELGGRISEILAIEIPNVKLPLQVAGGATEKVGHVYIEQQLATDMVAAKPGTWFAQLKGEKGKIGSKKRKVPLSPFAQRTLREYIDIGCAEGWLDRDGLLFPNTVGRPRSPGRVTTQIREAAEKLFGRRIVSHYFRHTFASNQFAADGASVEHVARLIGDTPKTTEARYIHLLDDVEFDRRAAAAGRQ